MHVIVLITPKSFLFTNNAWYILLQKAPLLMRVMQNPALLVAVLGGRPELARSVASLAEVCL